MVGSRSCRPEGLRPPGPPGTDGNRAVDGGHDDAQSWSPRRAAVVVVVGFVKNLGLGCAEHELD